MEFKEHFIDSLGYEIQLTSRVVHESFKRWFEKNVQDVTSEEFTIMDTLDCNQNLSQIELSNVILKGKAHTGKFLDSLAEKGYITRLYDMKNSRMVKIPILTDAGKKRYDEIREKMESVINRYIDKESKEKVQEIKQVLHKMRNTIIELENISFN